MLVEITRVEMVMMKHVFGKKLIVKYYEVVRNKISLMNPYVASNRDELCEWR